MQVGMSGVVRGLVCVGLMVSSGLARAQGTPSKATTAKVKAQHAKPGDAAPTSAASGTPAPAPSAPSPGASPSVPPKPEDDTAKPTEATPPTATAAPTSDTTASTPSSAPPARPTVRVFMRADDEPLVFSARAKNSDGTPTLCSSPCDERFLPGDYQLRLNGGAVEGQVRLLNPGTLHGEFISREGSREGGWLALNVGGILGGVFITVAALGGPSWAYIAGGGSLTAGGAIFLVTYRADSAKVSFSPGEPVDVRGLPPPVPAQDNSSGPSHGANLDRPGLGTQARGLGFRFDF
jgi:hypothetical protein